MQQFGLTCWGLRLEFTILWFYDASAQVGERGMQESLSHYPECLGGQFAKTLQSIGKIVVEKKTKIYGVSGLSQVIGSMI